MLVTLMLASCAPTIKVDSTETAVPSLTFTPVPQKSTFTPTSENIVQDFRFGNPVENDSQAQIAAQSALRASFNYTEPLMVIKTEIMSYGEYSKLIEQPLNQSANLKVWVVIYFNDEWQNVPPPTPHPPFKGCVYVAINASNGESVEVGGPLNKGILRDCDK